LVFARECISPKQERRLAWKAKPSVVIIHRPMSEEIVARVRDGFARMERDGVPDLEMLDPEIEVLNFDSFPVTRPYHGLDGVMRWFADVSEPFDDFRFELVEVLADDDERVVTTLQASGKSRAGGPPFELVWAAIWTFRDGRVVRVQGLRTPEEALNAAGL
jgi:ketosteroid isomerase-like protein